MSIKLDVNATLKREAERQAQPVPLPKVKVKRTGTRSAIAKRIMDETPQEVKDKVREYGNQVVMDFEKSIALRELNEEMRGLKKERAKLSTRTAHLVQEVTEMLRKESKGAANEFLKGNVPVPELKNHYERIQEYTDKIIVVFDKIRYIEQYGKLPVIKPIVLKAGNEDPEEIKAALYEKDRLIDLISKTKKKLTIGTKNLERRAMWVEKIALAEARLVEVSQKIIRLQYEARAERTGE